MQMDGEVAHLTIHGSLIMESDKEQFDEIQKKISQLKLRQTGQEHADFVKKLGIHPSRFTNELPEYRPIKKQSDGTSANETKTTKKPAGQKRDRTGDRGKRIKKAAQEYFMGLMKGEDVKKDEIAKKYDFTKEPNVLSKATVKKEYGLDKIEDAIEEAVRLFGSIAKIDDKEKARLHNLIYNTLKR
jgi:hypothetical protein